MIVLLNGAFGIGKTTVARLLVERLENATVFDPERIGFVLQRLTRVYDFQDLRLWRRLTILGLRLTRIVHRNVVVPMAFSNAEYLREIRDALSRFEPRVLHFCLVAPMDVVHARLRERGHAGEWEYRRAVECCAVHERKEFAVQIETSGRSPSDVVDELMRATTV